jgi:cysteine desulfurase
VRIYLDANAGAPLRPEARAAMLDVLDGPAANPASAHREGARSRAILEGARCTVAAALGARAADVVFTSGATEANNLALRGVLAAAAPGHGLVVGAIEHASVLETARALARSGVPLREVPVDGAGRLGPDDVAAACAEPTALASIGLANGEVGVVAPLAEIARRLRPRGVVVHGDGAQALGRVPVVPDELGIDLLSLSSHKLGGPAGVGALWVRPGTPLLPIATGGPQERARRAGTEPVAAIAGFAAAVAAAVDELPREAPRLAALRDRLWHGLRARVPDIVLHGPADGVRLPNTLNVGFPGCAGESLLVLLDLAGVAVSLGSACAAGSPEPSHVLTAMGLDAESARGGLRLSLAPSSTQAEIDAVVDLLPRVVAQVRRAAA